MLHFDVDLELLQRRLLLCDFRWMLELLLLLVLLLLLLVHESHILAQLVS